VQAVLDVDTLQQVLGRCPPRSAEVLTHASFDDWNPGRLAGRYGIPEPAAEVLLLRCARDFRFAAEGRPVPAAPLPDAEEQALARQLADALATPGAAAAEVRAHAEDLAALATHRDKLRRALEAAQAEAERSPARTRELWLRRVAIAVILAISAWSLWRGQHAPPERPPLPRADLPGR
jgi:hypothetical protein